MMKQLRNLISILPTASHTDTFLNCPWPWDKTITPEQRPAISDGTSYGTVFHAAMAAPIEKRARIAKDWPDDKELLEAVAATDKAVDAFVRGKNPWSIAFTGLDPLRETPFVLPLRGKAAGQAERCAPPSEDLHEYPEHRPGEIRGTSDYIRISRKRKLLLVLDYKTGWFSTYDIFEHGQLRTLALMAYKALVEGHPASHSATFDRQTWRIFTGIIEAKKDSPPQVIPEELPVQLLVEEHFSALQAAQDRVGHGFLRPGESWCRWCPAREICPVKLGETTAEARSIVLAAGGLLKKTVKSPEGLTVSNGGRFHQMSQLLKKLDAKLHDELLDLVRVGELIVRPDGKVLVITKRAIESVSKSSIKRGLGEERAEAIFNKLRKLECMEVSEREELRAMDNE
jgi:hypothetical protein